MFVMCRYAIFHVSSSSGHQNERGNSPIHHFVSHEIKIPVIFQEVLGTFSDEYILTFATTSGGLFMVVNSVKGLVAVCHAKSVRCVVKVDRFGREILVGE
jgi:hypothetical protein